MKRCLVFTLLCLWMVPARAGSLLTDPLTPSQAARVADTIEAMKKDVRGPYLRIRWFCNDGTIQPPAGTPCRERGGGVQHAEMNPQAEELAALGFHVGAVLQGLNFDEFFDLENHHARLAEFILQDYLGQIDDGWVLRRARFYRGARQIEDEERQGEMFLRQLLANKEWLRRYFFLATRVTAVIPHPGAAASRSSRIRNLASTIAQDDPGFANLRSKIHSFPAPDDAERVASYLKDAPSGVLETTKELYELLQQQYGSDSILLSLDRFHRRFPDLDLPGLKRSFNDSDPVSLLSRLALTSARLRGVIEESSDGGRNLEGMDLLNDLLEKGFAVSAQIQDQPPPVDRRTLLSFAADHLRLAFAAGLLSERELNTFLGEISPLNQASIVLAEEYGSVITYLARSLDWGRGTVLRDFSLLYRRYLSVEPKTVGFLDAVVRGSVLLPLARAVDRLSQDASRAAGESHYVLESWVSQGVRGLNPGIARGQLEIMDRYEPHWNPRPDRIYVLPDTFSELRPVAGILTLDAGNLLSHAQLLARNLGIPNASISPSLLPLIRVYDGREVVFLVSPNGTVRIKDPFRLTAEEAALLPRKEVAEMPRIGLNTSRIRLERDHPVPLSQLRANLSGVIVGPKAANMGELAYLFPDHVSPGFALPFGMYFRHLNRPVAAGGKPLIELIRKSYQQAVQMEKDGKSQEEVNAFIFERLAEYRQAVEQLEWIPEMRASILAAVNATFGPMPRTGVFVRSDTNAEDLPQFSGAGLNLTVANQVTDEQILTSIKRVWASPLSERAYLWRRQMLDNQSQIYASVLVQQSVPSERSGVLITSGLEASGPGDWTVVTSEGLGGGVEGERAETVLVSPAGELRLLSPSRATFRRVLNPAGGVGFFPTLGRESVLQPRDVQQLRQVVGHLRSRMPGAGQDQVWDIEFGFVDEKLWLFQIRPFAAHQNVDLFTGLNRLDDIPPDNRSRSVSMEQLVP